METLARASAWLRREQLPLPLAAILVAVAELISLRAVWVATFGDHPRLPESTALPLGHAVMWGLGLAGAVLSIAGAYRLLRRGRPWVAALVVPLICFPTMVVGLGSLYSSLVVAAVL